LVVTQLRFEHISFQSIFEFEYFAFIPADLVLFEFINIADLDFVFQIV